jgi:Mrp family chromosome partitioning ATPase
MGCGGTTQIGTPADAERAEQDKMIQVNLARINRKLIVMSGKGGVGKSTFSSCMALLLSKKGFKVGLLDIDLHGPSIPQLLNIKGGLDTSEEGKVRPYQVSKSLKVVSVGMLLGDKDAAVIWRGPLKISAIRQFISDIEWGDLDYLVVDSPPGTGDEPLTIVQTIPDAEALIVTTPQEVSVADVRKSVNFCKQVSIKVFGVVENMSGYTCPHCGEEMPIFGRGGAALMAEAMELDLLGSIPIDSRIVKRGDHGELDKLLDTPALEVNNAYNSIINKIIV